MCLENQGSLFEFLPQKTVFDLPNSEIILYDNFFTKKESDRLYKSLLNTVNWKQDQVTFYGKVMDVPRLTALFGEKDNVYTYSGLTMYPEQWHKDVLFIKRRVEVETKNVFTSCLINYYRTGQDSNDWHQDNEKELGVNPEIASVSFGATRTFQLKHITKKNLKKVDIPLPHGSFLLMGGETQHFWKHKIPKTKKNILPRINLTFRVIKPV